MKKFLLGTFMVTKYLVILIVGLVPVFVFKAYAEPGENFDAIYSILIWVVLLGIDHIQEVIYSHMTKKESEEAKNEYQTKG